MRRAWKKISLCMAWTISLKKGQLHSSHYPHMLSILGLPRYPTFIDALRDIDDALCVTYLFASLPSNSRIPPTLIKNCWRLGCEWQLYVMHSRSLRKVFLSIKGVYFQAEVMDQTITWLVPYQFTQTVREMQLRILAYAHTCALDTFRR